MKKIDNKRIESASVPENLQNSKIKRTSRKREREREYKKTFTWHFCVMSPHLAERVINGPGSSLFDGQNAN